MDVWGRSRGRGVTIRAAIIGTGQWAQRALVPALKAQPNVELIACVGETQSLASVFAAAQHIPAAFGGIDDLLASPQRPDLLVVATPDDVHAPATRAALTAGIAVYCEKPLANDVTTAWELADLARLHKGIGTVGYSFRYSPAIRALRIDLMAGLLGEPWLIELYEHNPQFHPKYGKPMNWKGDPKRAAAGALFEYGSHAVDLAGWLLGRTIAVSTNTATVVPGSHLDDIATLQLRFESGAIGTLVCGWVLSGNFPGIRIRLHGSEGLGEVRLSEAIPGGEEYRRLPLDGGTGECVPIEPLVDTISAYARRHIADFAAVIAQGPIARAGTLPTLQDGALVQDVLDAAIRGTAGWASVCVREVQNRENDKREEIHGYA
jgi:predicted dehydrogenase